MAFGRRSFVGRILDVAILLSIETIIGAKKIDIYTLLPNPQCLIEDSSKRESFTVLPLIQRLCDLMALEDIMYCHWKSNDVLERSANGKNDLDLLVSRTDVHRFAKLLYALGFKQAWAPTGARMPGVLDYHGYDPEADRIVHVHAHYQLIVGHDMTKNYRVPIEEPYLESALQDDLFKVPAPEFEFIVFVIRMILKHSTWDTILGREGTLKKAERRELAYLQAHTNQAQVYFLLEQHLPSIGAKLFDDFLQALQPDSSIWARIKAGQKLQNRLQAHTRRSQPIDTWVKLWRRSVLSFRRRILKSSSKYRLESGGAMIAIVGGDGAGKTTAVDAASAWLGETFDVTRVHMGKPVWSWTTIGTRGLLKLGNLLGLFPFVKSPIRFTLDTDLLEFPGTPWLLREVCTARDRWSTYKKARRFATNGGLVICDRFPLEQIQLMDGPQARRYANSHQPSRLGNTLLKLEESYYTRITLPELLVVLRVDPEIAVQRKVTETATSVRARSTEIWKIKWDDTSACVIDASQPSEDVLAELKMLIWSVL